METVSQQIFDRTVQTLTEKVEDASYRLGEEISVGGDEGVKVPELSLTPNKPNTARSIAQVRVAGEKAGELYVIQFAPNDSTGDYSDQFPAGSLVISDGLESNSGERGLYPRPKHQLGEICIPLANAWTESLGGLAFYGGTDLRILGIAKNEENEDMVSTIDRTDGITGEALHAYTDNPAFLTLGTDNFGRRVGDPHAIYNPSEDVQIAAFLAAEEARWLDLLAAFDPFNPYSPFYTAE